MEKKNFQNMKKQDKIDKLEKKIDGLMILILWIGASLWGLFSILFVIMFFYDVVNYRFLESIISFIAFGGSIIFFIKSIRLFDKILKKLEHEKTTKDNNARRI